VVRDEPLPETEFHSCVFTPDSTGSGVTSFAVLITPGGYRIAAAQIVDLDDGECLENNLSPTSSASEEETDVLVEGAVRSER
jgi:hypothetical protein